MSGKDSTGVTEETINFWW